MLHMPAAVKAVTKPSRSQVCMALQTVDEHNLVPHSQKRKLGGWGGVRIAHIFTPCTQTHTQRQPHTDRPCIQTLNQYEWQSCLFALMHPEIFLAGCRLVVPYVHTLMHMYERQNATPRFSTDIYAFACTFKHVYRCFCRPHELFMAYHTHLWN